MSSLAVPDLQHARGADGDLLDDDRLDPPVETSFGSTYIAAMAYAVAGWYVGPVRRGVKNPGSVLGRKWQHRTSRDPEQIHAWFSESDHGVFLHVGRSGAIVFDVDDPTKLPELLRRAIRDHRPPFQSTRSDVPGRGHYVFAAPHGRRLGNSAGTLGKAWGEVRGTNGVIIVEPSEHEKAPDGGRYLWLQTGEVPVLPDETAEAVPDTDEAEDAASDAAVAGFLSAHATAHSPERLGTILDKFDAAVAEGGSRHDAAVSVTCWAMREAFDGTYSAKVASDELRRKFLDAVGGDRGSTAAVRSEFSGILAWAVAQALDGAGARLGEARDHIGKLDADEPYCTGLEGRLTAIDNAGDQWRQRLPREVATAAWQATSKGCPGLPRLIAHMTTLAAELLGDPDYSEHGETAADPSMTVEQRRAEAEALVGAALASYKVRKELRTTDTTARCAHARSGLNDHRRSDDSSGPVVCQPDPEARAAAAGVQLGEVAILRAQLLTELQQWLHLPDPGHVWAALGTAATADEPDHDKPVWLQIVAPSSLGKTEVASLLAGVRAAQLGDITPAGLLAWSKGKNARPTGLLAGVRRGLVVFPDFSSLLSGADRGGRDKVFAMLRDVYDGSTTRTVQAPGAGADAQLTWQGRLTIISAVTVEIDRQLAHAQALGERWLYVRIAEPSREDQRRAARKGREAPTDAAEKATRTATALVLSAQRRLPSIEVPDEIHDAVEDAALVAAHGRATVPRSAYGAQEILGAAEIEGIGRMVKQLTGLARGLLAIGLDTGEVIGLVRRVALDSMPARRLRVLRVLAQHPEGPPEHAPLSEAEVVSLPSDPEFPRGSQRFSPWATVRGGWLVSPLARLAGLDRKAARRVLEEFDVIGLVDVTGDAAEVPDNVLDAQRRWRLSDEIAADVAKVLGPPDRQPDVSRRRGGAGAA